MTENALRAYVAALVRRSPFYEPGRTTYSVTNAEEDMVAHVAWDALGGGPYVHYRSPRRTAKLWFDSGQAVCRTYRRRKDSILVDVPHDRAVGFGAVHLLEAECVWARGLYDELDLELLL